MNSRHCLEYQRRAAGTALRDNGTPPNKAVAGIWKQKYQPCLTCDVGSAIRIGKGSDMDVAKLKQISPDRERTCRERTCRECGYHGPENDFYHSGGSYCNVCRKCVRDKKAKNRQGDKIVLDFSGYQEIFDNLQSSAKENFRSLNNEILYRLVNSNAS